MFTRHFYPSFLVLFCPLYSSPTCLKKMDFLEIFGVVFSLVYLWLELKQHPTMWIVGLISSLAYVFIFYQNKFYAETGMYIYYVIISVYGFYAWKFGGKGQSHELPVSRTGGVQALVLAAVTIALFFVIYLLLNNYTDSPVPIGDAFTTSLSIVATWMLARKMLEHWLIWIVVNVASAGLYFYKDMRLTAALFVVYGVLSVYGYFRWKRSMSR